MHVIANSVGRYDAADSAFEVTKLLPATAQRRINFRRADELMANPRPLAWLIRGILERELTDLSSDFHGQPLADVLLAPTRIYVKPVLSLMQKVRVKGLAHITGGGLVENLPRILDSQLTAELERESWPQPPLFPWLQHKGGVSDQEMFRVFNCGIGMVAIVGEQEAEPAIQQLRAAGERAYRIGRVRIRRAAEAQTLIV